MKQWLKHSGRLLPRDASLLILRGQGVSFKGVRLISHFTRTSSTTAAKQRTTEDEEDDNEDKVSNQRKIEASPEECDQIVEGLSLVKAKAKQVQEFLKKDEALIIKKLGYNAWNWICTKSGGIYEQAGFITLMTFNFF